MVIARNQIKHHIFTHLRDVLKMQFFNLTTALYKHANIQQCFFLNQSNRDVKLCAIRYADMLSDMQFAENPICLKGLMGMQASQRNIMTRKSAIFKMNMLQAQR